MLPGAPSTTSLSAAEQDRLGIWLTEVASDVARQLEVSATDYLLEAFAPDQGLSRAY